MNTDVLSMVKQIFEFDDYREFMQAYFKSLPREGFGQLSRTAKVLNIQPSLLTGILNSSKNMTQEQAFDFVAHIELSPLESEYFISLVHLSRAGTARVRKYYESKLGELRAKSDLLKNRLPPKAELPEQVKAQFYSEWFYSGVRMATSIESVETSDQIAETLGLPRSTVVKVLEFLLTHGLVKLENGAYELGPQSTHVGAGELLVSRHHTNWRLKAIEAIAQRNERAIHFTSPLSIAEKDIEVVRKMLMQSLDGIFDVVDASEAEKVACLCLDWFPVSS